MPRRSRSISPRGAGAMYADRSNFSANERLGNRIASSNQRRKRSPMTRRRTRSRSRSRSPMLHHRRSPSSPIAPRKRRESKEENHPAKLRSFVQQVQAFDESPTKSHSAKGSRTKHDLGNIFQGPEFGQVNSKELKKIQIDIRRAIPEHKISRSPIRRDLFDCSKLTLPRTKGEGAKRLFDRDEIRAWLEEAVKEERRVNLLQDQQQTEKKSLKTNERSSRPIEERLGGRAIEKNGKDLRSRLNSDNTEISTKFKESKSSIKDRLGPTNDDRRGRNEFESSSNNETSTKVLDRLELESQRPVTKPWEINPEFVPRAGYYFEHDNREDDREGGDDRFSRGNFRGRGHFSDRDRFSDRGRGRFSDRGRGRFSDRGQGRFSDRGSDRFNRFDRRPASSDYEWKPRRGRGRSPEWKHDLFKEVENSPDKDMQ